MGDTSRTHSGPVLATHRLLEVIQCETCAFAHLRMGGEEEAAYREGACPDEAWYQKERWEVAHGLWDPYFEAHLRLLRPFQPILDVGAGFGFFVQYARARGVRCDGTEISKRALARAPFLLTPEEAVGRYASLRLNLVLEHIRDPEGFLRGLIERHQPRVILITVPNEMNRCQRAIGGTWWVSSWHWNYFTPSSLCRLLSRLGYQARYGTGTYPMEWFVLNGHADYLRYPEMGRLAHLCRLLMEVHLGPRIYFTWYRQWFLHWRIGREMVYLFESLQPRPGEWRWEWRRGRNP